EPDLRTQTLATEFCLMLAVSSGSALAKSKAYCVSLVAWNVRDAFPPPGSVSVFLATAGATDAPAAFTVRVIGPFRLPSVLTDGFTVKSSVCGAVQSACTVVCVVGNSSG